VNSGHEKAALGSDRRGRTAQGFHSRGYSVESSGVRRQNFGLRTDWRCRPARLGVRGPAEAVFWRNWVHERLAQPLVDRNTLAHFPKPGYTLRPLWNST